MSETRKLAAILVADIAGYSADEDRILARLRSDLIDPTIAVYHGRVVERTGDGSIVEFRSVVDAVRCAIEVQSGLAERNASMACMVMARLRARATPTFRIVDRLAIAKDQSLSLSWPL